MPNPPIEVTLKVKTDDASIAKAQRAAASVGEAAKKRTDEATRSMERLTQRMQRMGETAERMQAIGATLAGIGAAITGPLLIAANSYVQAAGRAEERSRRWLVAQERIARAGQDVGRVVVQQTLPYLEKAVDLAEKAARFAEEHPEAIDAALKIGTVIAGLGAALVTAGQIAKTASNIGLLYTQIAGTRIGGAVAGAAPALGVAGAVVGGLGAGFAGHEALAKTELGQSLGMREGTAGKALSLVAYGLGSLVGKGDEAFRAVGEWTGQLEKTTQAATEAARTTGPTSLQELVGEETWRTAVDAYRGFQQENTDAAQQYEEQRTAIAEQYGQRRAQAEARYAQQRTDIIGDFAREQTRALRDFQRSATQVAVDFNRNQVRAAADFARSQAQADADYYAARALRARDFGIEVQRAEEDHQRSMERLREDYLNQVNDAEMDRDATAIYHARRNYDQQRQNAEEDYQTQAQRRNADHAQEIADQEAAYQIQRAQRLEEFHRQQDDAQQQYEEQRAQRKEEFEQQRQDALDAHQQRLDDLDVAHQDEQSQLDTQQQDDLQDLTTQYDNEKSLRASAFQEQLTALDAALTGQQALAQTKYAALEADFQAYLDGLQARVRSATVATSTAPRGSSSGRTSTRGGRQAGGYVDYGNYLLGEAGREFVLNAPTTRQLEGRYGALSQSTFNQMGTTLSISANFTGMGNSDRGWYEARLQQFGNQLIGELARALG